jgi:hypothetical protein
MDANEFWRDLTGRPTATFLTIEPFMPVKPACSEPMTMYHRGHVAGRDRLAVTLEFIPAANARSDLVANEFEKLSQSKIISP